MVCRGKRISVTYFEFNLNDKIGGSEGETTPEPFLLRCGQNLVKKCKERERCTICDWALRVSRRVCWSSAETGGQRIVLRCQSQCDRPHTRRRQSPTTCENWLKPTHTESQHLKRTDFGGPRRCIEHRGNVFVTERSADGNYKRNGSAFSNGLAPRSIVWFAMRVPSYSAANRDDEYNVKTSKSRWPRITPELRELPKHKSASPNLLHKINSKLFIPTSLSVHSIRSPHIHCIVKPPL